MSNINNFFNNIYGQSYRDIMTGYDKSEVGLTLGYDTSARDLTLGYDTSARDLTSGYDTSVRDLTSGYDTSVRDLTSGYDKSESELTSGYDKSVRDLISGYDKSNSDLISGSYKSEEDIITKLVKSTTETGKKIKLSYKEKQKLLKDSYKKLNTDKSKKYILFIFILITVLITLYITLRGYDQSAYNSFFSITNSSTFYTLMIFIVFFVIILSLVIFDTNIFTSNSKEETVGNILILLFSSIIILTLCITFLPGLKDLKNLFQQINNITYVIVYTIFVILFYTMMPYKILNKYSDLINIFVLLLGIIVYYKGFTTNYTEMFNINYEKIKNVIIFLCLIITSITLYMINPGNIVEKYSSQTFLLTSVLSVFGFLYLIISLGVGDTSNLGIYGMVSYILLIVGIIGYIAINKSDLSENKTKSAAMLTLVLLISILSIIMIGSNIFSDKTLNYINANNYNIYKKGLFSVFGLVISGLCIYLIAHNIQNVSGKTTVTSFILNLLLISVILGLIIKTINTDLPYGNNNKNAFFSIILNTILYIPCILTNISDWIGKIAVGEYNAQNAGSFIMLFVSIVLIIAYIKTPTLLNYVSTQGGKQLVNKPVSTDTEYNLGNYEELNGSEKYDYQYAISFWVYLDAAPPNTNPNYNKFTSLLNFGNKPNILYNSKKNTLMITVQQKDLKNITKNKLTDFDSEGNRIIYINENVLLQKWNNIIINYNGGTMDIFLNGELVKSSIEVVPYYTLDKLTIGENDGIKGGISNLVYFKNVLTTSNIYYLYNTVKNRNPPVLNDDNETLMVRL
jgi:hypothetical protein